MIQVLKSLQKTPEHERLEPSSLSLGDAAIRVVFRRHATARRLILRLEPGGTGLVVTVPRGVSRLRALDFVERSRNWISSQLDKRGRLTRLEPGELIRFRGVEHEIRHIRSRRGLVTTDPLQRLVHVPGDLLHVRRRLLAFLKAEARADLTQASTKYADLMGVSFRRITLRDQKSRWGSCSASGELSYSWRLILTPEYVLDYVAAHEVAHLRHLNHGPRFWRLLLTHCPHATEARDWLRLNGQQVHLVVA